MDDANKRITDLQEAAYYGFHLGLKVAVRMLEDRTVEGNDELISALLVDLARCVKVLDLLEDIAMGDYSALNVGGKEATSRLYPPTLYPNVDIAERQKLDEQLTARRILEAWTVPKTIAEVAEDERNEC